VAVNILDFYNDTNLSGVKTQRWQWNFWQVLELVIPISMVLSVAIMLALRSLLPESFVQTQWNLMLAKHYKQLGSIDWLILHMEEVMLFNMNVAPVFVNSWLVYFNPKNLDGFDESKEKNLDLNINSWNVFVPIWVISGLNAVFYICF
jgi:hypothetical protein